MTAPLYFLPSLRRADLAKGTRLERTVLARFGLDAVLSDVETTDQAILTEVTGKGPSGVSGLIVCGLPVGGHAPFQSGYDPRIQEWAPIAGGDGAWLGLERGSPPTPAELSRRRQFSGYGITLGDGAAWEIPIVRRPDGTTELPRSLGWDAGGKFETRVKEAYRQVWEETAEIVGWLFQDGEPGDPPRPRERVVTNLEVALDRCLAGLAINYRYGRSEQQRIGLVDSTNWASVLAAIVDLPFYLAVWEWEKKSASGPADGTESTPPGAGDCSAGTDPAGAN